MFVSIANGLRVTPIRSSNDGPDIAKMEDSLQSNIAKKSHNKVMRKSFYSIDKPGLPIDWDGRPGENPGRPSDV
jgi:hypothetical protein